MRFNVILALVEDTDQESVIKAAKEAGATGATILNARGEGIHKKTSFLGLELESHKDALLFLVEENISDEIMDAIYKAGHFDKKGAGVAFCWTVNRAIGLESQIKKLEEEARSRYF